MLRGQEQIGREHVEAAYERLLSRKATSVEVAEGLAFIDRQAEALRAEGRSPEQLAQPVPSNRDGDPFSRAALVDFCLALANSNEFLYLE